MRQVKQRIVGPQGQAMTRTLTEIRDPCGLRFRAVEDVVDLETLLAEHKRHVPLWRRIWQALKRGGSS